MKQLLIAAFYLLLHQIIFAQGFSKAEYFFDTDPGIGNGTAITLNGNSNTLNFSANIPTSLATGPHVLGLRVKHNNGQWGLIEHRAFYVSPNAAAGVVITAAEYFFDSDPGVGNGISTSVGANAAIVNFTANIPAALSTGFHTLAIRTKSSEGKWSLFEQRAFYISPTAAAGVVITAAEYFFDTDPGTGNGTPLSINPPGAIVNQTFNINTSVLMAQGPHYVAIRVKDTQGKWSLFDYGAFTLDGLLYTWTGNTNTIWNTNTNWVDATLPATGADIRIPAGVPNMPALTTATTIGNLSVATNTTLNLNSQPLTINGNVTGTGTFTGSSASTLIIGGAAGVLNFTSGSQILKDLTLRPGTSAALGTPLQITAGATPGTVIDSLGAVLTTNGNLTLKSDDNGTARIGRSAGTIVGNVTVERISLTPATAHGICWLCQQPVHKLFLIPGRKAAQLCLIKALGLPAQHLPYCRALMVLQ